MYGMAPDGICFVDGQEWRRLTEAPPRLVFLAITPPSPRVAVILLNHADYAARHLEACYDSLVHQTYPSDSFSVFIVSNGVSPEAQAFIGRVAPAARRLENPANLGWSGGNNTALRAALQEDFAYVVLLNIDCVVEEGWLAALVEAAQQRPDVQAHQPDIGELWGH